MTETQRKESLARVRKLAHDARRLSAYDGVTTPPDWRPFVAELADEVAKIFAIAVLVNPPRGPSPNPTPKKKRRRKKP